MPPKPKKIGILTVGIGGGNGVTMLAGVIANRKNLSWETQTGKVSAPNWNGCITQLPSTPTATDGVGYADQFELADATTAVYGGWDIRPTKLGDALYDARILDYDLVRQVRDEMNDIPILKGIYDKSFVGESQHATATHIVEGRDTYFLRDKVEHIRNDIRKFKFENSIDGHITVIWSASVERPANVDFKSADHLIQTIMTGDTNTRQDVSPSILYAVAAALEGCSFVNGGSQNTISPGMMELFESDYRAKLNADDIPKPEFKTNPCYMLGTDFKAGQTKFKTAAVEYIRNLGLKPKVIASSNHLGNNDMLNLTSKATVEAKMRVKSNIFGPWQEDQLDHQVRVMYTPYMGDEKRDVVEYTSLGFLHSPHTMLTYTRCMDSILCVPLMIDAAVFCDYFSRFEAPSQNVARATAYLFKVPEGGAMGVDPGFAKQMQALEQELKATVTTNETSDRLQRGFEAGIITKSQLDQLLALQ